jgi:hypothetical protein
MWGRRPQDKEIRTESDTDADGEAVRRQDGKRRKKQRTSISSSHKKTRNLDPDRCAGEDADARCKIQKTNMQTATLDTLSFCRMY